MTAVVLVVDDEHDIRLLARIVLEGAGYEVREASSGQEAIALLDEGGFDVVLLDLRMSPIDGWGVLEHLREVGLVPSLPVVMLSAHADPAMAARAVELGCVGYLSKPFDTEELVAAVGNQVGDE